jgi:hypothetical protein
MQAVLKNCVFVCIKLQNFIAFLAVYCKIILKYAKSL